MDYELVGCRSWGSGSIVQGSASIAEHLRVLGGFDFRSMDFEALGIGVWSVGFSVQGLGFGGWGSGFRL